MVLFFDLIFDDSSEVIAFYYSIYFYSEFIQDSWKYLDELASKDF